MIRNLFTFAFSLFFIAMSQQAQASHLSAAEFEYEHISGNDYLVTLYLYRDCNGVGLGTTASVNLTSANCSVSNTISFPRIGTPTIVMSLPATSTTCGGGAIQGYEEHVYQTTVTMPAACTDWIFSYSSCCRNGAITNLVNASSKSFYVESSLDNTVINNSPRYYIDPVFYGSQGSNFSVALGGFDVDGDQLVFSLAAPLESSATAISFTTGLSVAQPLNIAANTSVNFSTTTGQFNCTLAPGAQIVVFDVIVEEWRNNVKIAEHRRSVQLLPLNLAGSCMPPPTASGLTNATFVDPYTIEYNTPGQPLSFSLMFDDPDASDVITLNNTYSSIYARFPNAQITTSNPGANQNQLQVDVTLPTPENALFMFLLEENNLLQQSFTYELRQATGTSVDNIASEAKINVYPNPMETITTFEILEGNYQAINLQVYDMTGRQVYNQNAPGQKQIQFNRQAMPAGVYMYQLFGDGEMIKADLLEMK